MSGQIRVLIVDDDALVRAGLSLLLSGAEDIAIVGEAADGSEVTSAVAEHAPDVVLMDIRMPAIDGLAATELLRGQDNPPEVIVLTTFEADDYVLRALRAGAGAMAGPMLVSAEAATHPPGPSTSPTAVPEVPGAMPSTTQEHHPEEESRRGRRS